VALLLIGSVAAPAGAQLPGLKKIKDAAKKVTKSSDSATTKRDSAGKAAPAKPGAPATPDTRAAAPAADARPVAPQADARVWENYDFVPGNKVIFFTDFSEDRVGNFARGLKHRAGPLEVVERGGVKVLRATGRSEFLIPVGKRLPERFTLEIDIIAPNNGQMNEPLSIEGGPTLDRGTKSAAVSWNPFGAWILGSGKDMSNSPVKIPEEMSSRLVGNVAHVRVLMDSAYFKMYVNERRLYNIPDLAFRRDSVIRVFMAGAEEAGKEVYLTSIRVAESETDVLYDALASKGRWATQGILFATGKADIQPESRPVLKEIAGTLEQHAELKILIEGHTDNVGTPASNLALSDARAAAVKAALVAEYGIEESRITTKGLGDTKPAVPNATASGRAQNRRVEVVKQ
jgi:outer membrane protein OmpA-like peptidoglycan-associated protein